MSQANAPFHIVSLTFFGAVHVPDRDGNAQVISCCCIVVGPAQCLVLQIEQVRELTYKINSASVTLLSSG
jgi:hypothetical protein